MSAPSASSLTEAQRGALVALFIKLLSEHGKAWTACEGMLDEIGRACVPEDGADALEVLARVRAASTHLAEVMRDEGCRMEIAFNAIVACFPSMKDGSLPAPQPAIH